MLYEQILALIDAGDVRISEHGYDERADDHLTAREVIRGARDSVVLEEYSEYPKGPCLLLLQRDANRAPIHVIWGIPKGYDKPEVLNTAYRPDPDHWDENLMQRR